MTNFKSILDALVSVPNYARFIDEASRAADYLRQQDEMISQLNSTQALEAMQAHNQTIRQLTSSPVLEAFRQQDELARQMLNSPLIDAMREQDKLFKQFVDAQSAMAAFSVPSTLADHARTIAEQASGWQHAASLAVTEFHQLIPDSAFLEVNRIAEAVRLSAPDLRAFDSTLVAMNWDAELTAVVAEFRKRAEAIASDPEADVADVETFVAEANATASTAPPQARAAMNVYLKYLTWWLLGTLAEDPVKAAAHKALATLMIFLHTLQPVTLPALPSPPALLAPAPFARPLQVPDDPSSLPVPGGWQIEGLPDVIRRAGPKAATRTLEFFSAEIRNPNTRRAYAHASLRFFTWCDDRNLELDDITPFVVAAYIEELQREVAAPTVKQHLAAIKMLFDWLVVGQVLPMNPAALVRGPKHVVKRGKTPVLTAEQARTLLDSIDTATIDGLRDRAVIGLMVYSFARVSAAMRMNVADYYASGKRWWLRLSEKGGKRHDVPAHHNAEEYLDAYLESAGIAADASGPLFRTLGRDRRLTDRAMTRTDVLRMIKRRAAAAGLPATTCCHTFRATGITTYLLNGGTIERAQQIAAHESIRTTKLYDRTNDELTLDEIEKIII